MATRIIETSYEADIKITIADDAPDDVLTRCFTDEWRGDFYTFDDEDAVIEHLAYNACANGVWDASQLDGWADLPQGALMMEVQ